MPDALDIGLERFSKQLQEFEALVSQNNGLAEVLLSIHDNGEWKTIERIFWAFEFGYLLGIHADHDQDTAFDMTENRGYQ